jgi:energy-coupling factor transporter ATP-binding protein EcfA2
LLETITSVQFKNYKALRNFSIKLTQRNILVGPNNFGKSTIIGAFRVLAEGLRKARSKSPEFIFFDGSRQRGYRIPEESIAISTENVHTNYEDVDSSVTFRISNGNQLHLIFPNEGGCLLIPETERSLIASPKSFKEAFPITIAVVPVLGPLEHDEPRVESATVLRNLHTTRASRHFRNYWRYFPDGFERFTELITQTWPEMSLAAPVDNGEAIHMFCSEDRIPRELFWSGFGFQVWCQLLTHLDRGRNESIIVVDEPEIYLHADLQRQLLEILFPLGPSIIMATHSSEIIGAADARDVVIIDKKTRKAQRLATDETVQQALDSIGSLHIVALTRIARHRRVLFVEGNEYPLLLKFAKTAGLLNLASSKDLPAVPSDGFSNWTRVRDAIWIIHKILNSPFKVASVLDRDYRSKEEIEAIKTALESKIDLSIILDRKEIENYLLVPSAIARAIKTSFRKHKTTANDQHSCDVSDVENALMTITDSLRRNIQAQYSARRGEYLNGIGDKRDLATIYQETADWFELEWATLEGRIRVVPGKDVLSSLREWAQERYATTLTTDLILSKMVGSDLARDLRETLEQLDLFRLSRPSLEVEDRSSTEDGLKS